MADESERERLIRLEERINRAKSAQEPRSGPEDHHTQAQAAWRMVIELVTGLLLGFGIGYGLDALFGTRPILLVLFTLLGFAAGVRTMLRTAEEIAARSARDTADTAARTERDDGRG